MSFKNFMNSLNVFKFENHQLVRPQRQAKCVERIASSSQSPYHDAVQVCFQEPPSLIRGSIQTLK